MKRILLFLPIGILCASLSISCTKDQNYNLEKIENANGEMTLFEDGITVPVDTTLSMSVSKALNFDRIKADPSGDLYVDIVGIRIADKSVSVPAVEITDPCTSGITANVSTGSYAGITLGNVEIRNLASISDNIRLELVYDIPQDIDDIKSIDVKLPMILSISTDLSSNPGAPVALVQAGFTLCFPKGFKVQKTNSSETWYTIHPAAGGNEEEGPFILTVSEDMPMSSPMSIMVNICKITVQDGWIKGRKLDIGSQLIAVNGSLDIKGPGTVPDSFKFKTRVATETISTTGALVKVSKSLKFEDRTIDVPLPEAFRKDNITLVFTDGGMEMSINNGSPLSASVSGTVSADSREGSRHTASFKDLKVAASGTSVIKINEDTCPGILSIINCIPEKITITDLNLDFTSNDYINVSSERSYNISSTGRICMPLSFGKGTDLNFSSTFQTDAMFYASAKLNGLGICAEITNNFPLDLSAKAFVLLDGEQVQLLNKDGSPIEIKAGQKTAIDAVIAKKDGSAISKMGDVKLEAGAKVTGAVTKFNKDNNISLNVKSVSAPNGITITAK